MNDFDHERSEEPGRRCDDTHCPAHTAQAAAIAKHSGQWKMLMLILIVALAGFYNMQRNIQKSAHTIETTVIAYMASHQAESRDGFRRILHNETYIKELSESTDARLDRLERFHPNLMQETP
jgi:hypothetical protein